jgi:hypothetical protein
MATINLRENRQIIEYLARDYDSLRQAMVDLIPAKLPEWTDRSEADFGIALLELVAYAGDILSYYVDRQTNECFAATAQERRSVINNLRLIGYEMAGAAPAAARLSLLYRKDLKGVAEIRPGDQFATRSSREQRSVTFEYVDRKPLLIELGHHPLSETMPDYREARDVVPLREGTTVNREVVGVSDGTPNQVFALGRPAVLRSSIEVSVETETPTGPWRLRKTIVAGPRAYNAEQLAALQYQDRIASNLGFSRAPDRDFAIETDADEITSIRFGDGQYGMIPPSGGRIVARYRVGGGTVGNVGAGQIAVIALAPQLNALGIRVSNRTAASGGAERESIEQAIRFAPTVFSSMNRAVTADDFVAQAMLFPGVSKARAVALNWNTVALYVAPTGNGEEPSDILQRDMLAYFEDKRMLTVQVSIRPPDYRGLKIKVSVGAEPYFRQSDVEAQVRATIRQLYDFERAEFGQKLYLSKLYEALEALESVAFVNVETFELEDRAADGQGLIELKDNELAVLRDGLQIMVSGGVSEGGA